MQELLSNLNSTDTRIKGSAIASRDGWVLACSAHKTLDEDFLGAMGAALFAIGSKSLEGLVGGNIKQITVESEHGYVFLNVPNENSVFIAVAEQGVDTQAIFRQMFSINESLASQSALMML